mgnify:CR=1 FL=1
MLIRPLTMTAVVFLLLIKSSLLNANEIKSVIYSSLAINSAYCGIKINQVVGLENRTSAYEGRGLGSSSINTVLMLENGINDIAIDFGSLDWFSKNEQIRQRNTFTQDAYCNLQVKLETQHHSVTLTTLNIKIDDHGIPYANSEDGNGKPAPKKIVAQAVTAFQTEDGHLDSQFLIDNFYPSGMKLFQFTSKLRISGLPEWKWVKATPVTGTSAEMDELKHAYLKLWTLFSKKDTHGIKKELENSLNAWMMATGSDQDEIYESNDFPEDFNNPDFEMIPINWNDYRLEIVNKGRMVRLVNKSDPAFFPVSYYIKDEGRKFIGTYSPWFSLINRKFVPVI